MTGGDPARNYRSPSRTMPREAPSSEGAVSPKKALRPPFPADLRHGTRIRLCFRSQDSAAEPVAGEEAAEQLDQPGALRAGITVLGAILDGDGVLGGRSG
jgi:hypothetical protein